MKPRRKIASCLDRLLFNITCAVLTEIALCYKPNQNKNKKQVIYRSVIVKCDSDFKTNRQRQKQQQQQKQQENGIAKLIKLSHLF